MPLTDLHHSYLYKLHRLSTSFHNVLDQRVRLHTGIGLSQGILLAYISQHQPVSQQQIAEFLDITPGAVSRQIEASLKQGWVKANDDETDRRKQLLRVTPKGQKIVDEAYSCLKEFSDAILKDKLLQTDLMSHIELMQQKIDDIDHN